MIPKRRLMRGGPKRIYHWPAIPPEAPVPAYHAFDTTTHERGVFPTLRAATEWLDQCPLLRALPFDQEES